MALATVATLWIRPLPGNLLSCFLSCVADFKRIPTIKNFTLAIKNFTLRPPSKKNKIVTIQYFHRLEEKPWVRG